MFLILFHFFVFCSNTVTGCIPTERVYCGKKQGGVFTIGRQKTPSRHPFMMVSSCIGSVLEKSVVLQNNKKRWSRNWKQHTREKVHLVSQNQINQAFGVSFRVGGRK